MYIYINGKKNINYLIKAFTVKKNLIFNFFSRAYAMTGQ